MPRRLLLALALVTACTRGTADAPPPLDSPPAEPPPVPAEVAPEPAPEPEPEPPPPPAPTLDLAATALEAGDLTTFLTAVDIAGLRDRLTGPGPLTVFAPSDAAFAALPKAELDRLLKNKKKLAALLGHHIVVGAAVSAADLPTQTTPLRTAAGTDLTPSTLAAPTRPDLEATNGVLHIIDVVLQPTKPGAKPTPPNKPQEPAAKPAPDKTQEPAKKSQEPAAKPAPDKSQEPAKKSQEPAAKPAPDKSQEPAKKSQEPAAKPAPDKTQEPAKKSQEPAEPPAATPQEPAKK